MDIAQTIVISIACFFISLFVAFLLINDNSYIIIKSEWNCTKSLILDNNNVDQVTCIEYRKVTDNE
jgi:hypothetical protein